MKKSTSSVYGLDEYNVLFVTLDCCRYDTLKLAKTPFLDKLGTIRKAKTHGTYTLPAHLSFFMGYLPIVDQAPLEPYYSAEVRQLWRLQGSRSRELDTVGLILEGKNIVWGYKNLGFKTIGTGGVRWFRNPTLTESFDDFLFWGPNERASVFDCRKKNDFSLNHLNKILELIKDNKYFLFINCLETHVPYDFGEGLYSKELYDIIYNASPIWGCKTMNITNCSSANSDLKKLHLQQIKAVESLDYKLKNLITKLEKPLLVVICGDHGECFGENMLWGHGSPHQKVMEVPLIVALID